MHVGFRLENVSWDKNLEFNIKSIFQWELFSEMIYLDYLYLSGEKWLTIIEKGIHREKRIWWRNGPWPITRPWKQTTYMQVAFSRKRKMPQDALIIKLFAPFNNRVSICTTSLILHRTRIHPYTIFIDFVRLSELTFIISLNSINEDAMWLCELETEVLNVIWINFRDQLMWIMHCVSL